MMQEPVVRAVDVGYGHVKFSDGRIITTGEVRTDSFPSQSPMAPQQQLDAGVMQRRDTFTVPLNGRRYEVGKGITLKDLTTKVHPVHTPILALSRAVFSCESLTRSSPVYMVFPLISRTAMRSVQQ
jgi:hypothetical protein